MKTVDKINIYVPEQVPQRSVDISFGATYFELELSEMTPKMRTWLSELIRSHNWTSRQHITGWDEPIYNLDFSKADGFHWQSYEERCALHWVVLGEPYVGTHLEESLATLRYFWQGITHLKYVFQDMRWHFEGGLFSNPRWIK